MKDPKREKPQTAMSQESTMMMRAYKFNIRVVCPKKRSIVLINSLRTLSRERRIVELMADQTKNNLLGDRMMLVFAVFLDPAARPLIK